MVASTQHNTYVVASDICVMLSTESMSFNSGKITSHSFRDPVDLAAFTPEATINDEVSFWLVELGLEFVMP